MQLPHWVLSHVVQGEVHVVERGSHFTARTGDVMLHVPHQPFSETAATPGIHQYLIFDATIGPGLDLLRWYAVHAVVPLAMPHIFSAHFAALRQAWLRSDSQQREIQLLVGTLQLINLVVESATQETQEATSTHDERFVSTVNYIAAHLHERIQRADLARLAHLHPTHFDRVFRARYGVTPMALVRDLRLQRVKRLLEETNDTLDSIAVASGLHDAGYLSRVFTAQFGQTPGAHRQRVKNAKQGYIHPL